MTAGAELDAAIRSPRELFPQGLFAFAAVDTPMATDALHPLEHDLVRDAVAKRRGEFAAGRHCARRALLELGIGFVPILRDRDGCPLWPDNIVGSISHTSRCIVGVAARSAQMKSVGVDVESLEQPFPRDILRTICTSHELDWLSRVSCEQFDACAYGLFSAKEAVYKCVFSAIRLRLGFDDVEIDLDLECGVFGASLRGDPRVPARTNGRVGCSADHVFAAMWWPRWWPQSWPQFSDHRR